MADVDLEALRRLTRLKEYAPIHLRLFAVLLAAEGLGDRDIAQELGGWPAWVRRWRERFEAQGVDGLWDQRRSGQPTKLTRDREQAFIARVLAGPRPADVVTVWRGEDLRHVLSDEFGARSSLRGVYALLRRLKLSWLAPRPAVCGMSGTRDARETRGPPSSPPGPGESDAMSECVGFWTVALVGLSPGKTKPLRRSRDHDHA